MRSGATAGRRRCACSPHGAELDRRGGECSTPPEQWRTAYQNAVLRGRDEAAALLAQLGASTQVAPEDLAVAALSRGERPAAPLPPADELGADARETLILAVLDGRHLDLIVDAVGPTFFGHVGGGPPGTLLHHRAGSATGDRRAAARPRRRSARTIGRRVRHPGRLGGAGLAVARVAGSATTSRSSSGWSPRARRSSRPTRRWRRVRSPPGSPTARRDRAALRRRSACMTLDRRSLLRLVLAGVASGEGRSLTVHALDDGCVRRRFGVPWGAGRPPC